MLKKAGIKVVDKQKSVSSKDEHKIGKDQDVGSIVFLLLPANGVLEFKNKCQSFLPHSISLKV